MKKTFIKKTLLLSVVTFLFLSLTLSGCGNLTKPKKMIKEIEEMLPGCEVISVNESDRINTYTVKYNGIEFKVINELQPDGLFGDYATFSSDYFTNILKEEKVQALLEKYDVYHDDLSEFSKMEAYVTDSAELREIYDFLGEFYNCVYEYLPEKDFYRQNFSLSINYKDDENEEWITSEFISVRGEINWDYLFNTRLIDIKAEINTQSTDDEAKTVITPDFFTDVNYDSIPERFIETLYINGNKFESEKEDITFVYYLSYDAYYVPIQINYNYEIDDHLMKDIISSVYPDSNFTIDSESYITTYKINGNDYKLYYYSENDRPSSKNESFNSMVDIFSNDEYRFYRNNKKLNIYILENVDGHSTRNSLDIFIKVEDWADLMEMNIDRIDESGVYMSVK